MYCFPFLRWIKFCSGCFRQIFFSFGRQKKVVAGLALDRWLSYAVTTVWELGGLSIGRLRRVVAAGSKRKCQVPGSRCQVPGSSIRKNKLWIDLYTSNDVFRGFLGISLVYRGCKAHSNCNCNSILKC